MIDNKRDGTVMNIADSQTLKKLKKRRATLKTTATKFSNFLREYQAGEPDFIKLNVRLERFMTQFKDFDEASDQIELLDENPDLIDERFQLDETYTDLITLDEQLKLDVRPNNSDDHFSQPRGSSSSNPEQIPNDIVLKRRIKLPEASLPKFDGHYEDWLSFKDAFTSMIISQKDLNNVEKLQYLKSALFGEAINKIKNFSITNENFNRAWDLLEKTYADKRLIVGRHLSLLLRLPIQDTETAEGLRQLADETQQHLESLKMLNVNVTEQIIVQLLEEKLHRTTAEKWEETLERGVFPKLEKMLDFLYKTASRLSKRERDQTETVSNHTSKTIAQERGKKYNKNSAKQIFLSSANKSCPICKENKHLVYKCENFRSMSIPKRIQAAKDASLCLNCLRNHGDKTCTFSKCIICSESHNTLLHSTKEQDNLRNNQQ